LTCKAISYHLLWPLLLALCLVVAAVHIVRAGDEGFAEGLWEIMATDEFIGVATDIPPTTFSECLTREEPVPHLQWTGESCDVIGAEFVGQTLTWQLQCQTPYGEKEKQGVIRFDGDQFSGTITPGQSMPGMRTVTVTRLEGRFGGQCDLDEEVEAVTTSGSGQGDSTADQYANEEQEEEPLYRWQGTVQVRQKSEGPGTLTGVYDSTWTLQVRWKERQRIDVRDQRNRLTGQFVELVDDGSTWAGKESGTYAISHQGTLSEGTLNGEGEGRGRTISYGWIYYSMTDDDPLAAIYPNGAYCFGGQAGLPSFTTHGFYRTTDPWGKVSVSNITHPNAALLGYGIGKMLLDPNPPAVLRVSELLGYHPPAYTKLGFDQQMRTILDDTMSASYDNQVHVGYQWNQPAAIRMIVSWDLKRVRNVQVELEKTRRNWRPRGGDQANIVSIRAKIKNKGVKGKFLFRLEEVSTEKGYCMNAGDQSDHDLEFIEQSGFDPPEDEGLTIETLDAVSETSVQIQANDYGAWGKLKVRVIVDGEEFQGEAEDGKEYVTIPRDDDEDHIADRWEEHFSVDIEGAETDEDGIPEAAQSGDGFSNYEEYRGFEVNGYWEEYAFDPTYKDLFIYDELGADLSIFEKLGLAYHLIKNSEHQNKVVNFNRGYGTLPDQQHSGQMAVHIHPGELSSGLAGTVLAVGSPNVCGEVIIADPSAHVVAHELGHCINLPHHGNPDQEYDWVAYPGGKWSGDISCTMRYRARPDEYVGPEGNRHSYPDDEGGDSCNDFCNHKVGTGINAPDHTPHPVTGNATHGDCRNRVKLKGYEREY